MTLWLRCWLVLVIGCGLGSAAPAQGLQVAGFGTVSAYRGDDALAAVKPVDRAHNSSMDSQWRWDGDSVLGVQLRWELQEELEVVWQAQARDDLVRRYRPTTEWAYISWRPQPGWMVRAGRQPLPVYLNSEVTRVGFARVSVRPMSAVYGLNGSEPTDAVTVSWSGSGLGGGLTMDLGAGRNRIDLTRGQVDTTAATIAALRWQRDGLSLRIGLSTFRFNLVEPVLAAQFAALTQAGSACQNCAEVLGNRARMQGIQGRLVNAGLIWERGRWTLTAELMRRGSDSVFGADVGAWYAQLARRVGAFTPYVAVGESRFHEAPLGLRAVPGAPGTVADALAGLDLSLQSPLDRRIVQAGLRWDFAEQAALKLQYEQWHATRDRSTPRSGEITLPPPAAGQAGWDGKVGLLTLSLDFVF